jgi:hypothetical protein
LLKNDLSTVRRQVGVYDSLAQKCRMMTSYHRGTVYSIGWRKRRFGDVAAVGAAEADQSQSEQDQAQSGERVSVKSEVAIDLENDSSEAQEHLEEIQAEFKGLETGSTLDSSLPGTEETAPSAVPDNAEKGKPRKKRKQGRFLELVCFFVLSAQRRCCGMAFVS